MFRDSGCQYFPSIEWAIGGGAIIASALTDDKYTCLDVAGGSTAPGSTVVVNPCKLGAGSQRWEIKPETSTTQIINIKSKLCLDTTVLGPDVTGLVVNTCSVSAGGQAWQVK